MAAGARLKEERERQGRSQQEIADAVTAKGYKISQTGIDKIEHRDTQRPKCARELALVLGVSERWLIEGKPPKEIDPEAVVAEFVSEARQLPENEQRIIFANFRALLAAARQRTRGKIGG